MTVVPKFEMLSLLSNKKNPKKCWNQKDLIIDCIDTNLII